MSRQPQERYGGEYQPTESPQERYAGEHQSTESQPTVPTRENPIRADQHGFDSGERMLQEIQREVWARNGSNNNETRRRLAVVLGGTDEDTVYQIGQSIALQVFARTVMREMVDAQSPISMEIIGAVGGFGQRDRLRG